MCSGARCCEATSELYCGVVCVERKASAIKAAADTDSDLVFESHSDTGVFF